MKLLRPSQKSLTARNLFIALLRLSHVCHCSARGQCTKGLGLAERKSPSSHGCWEPGKCESNIQCTGIHIWIPDIIFSFFRPVSRIMSEHRSATNYMIHISSTSSLKLDLIRAPHCLPNILVARTCMSSWYHRSATIAGPSLPLGLSRASMPSSQKRQSSGSPCRSVCKTSYACNVLCAVSV